MTVDKSKFRKELLGPFTGTQFTIRRVRFKEFVVAMGTLPVTTTSSVQEVLASLSEKGANDNGETEDKISQFYASKGVIEPKLWFGAEQDCPEDSIYFEDLGGDFDYVVNEVIKFSHEMVGLAEFEKFFRRPGAGDPGLDVPEVRPAAEQPAADGGVPE